MSAPAMKPCLFCSPNREILVENADAIAVPDGHPVSQGHALVLPRRHAATIWELEPAEYAACFGLVRELRALLDARYSPDAYTVGANCGEAAGQSVWHAHLGGEHVRELDQQERVASPVRVAGEQRLRREPAASWPPRLKRA